MVDLNLEEIKLIHEVSKPLIQPLINSLITPKIDRLNNWLKKRNNDYKIEDHYWENKFSKYLQEIYKESSFLTTLVFPNTGTKIKKLYVPLTIISYNGDHIYQIKENENIPFDKFSRIIISDYAGMGKSTLLKWITLSVIEQNISIPILIELRKINEKNSLLEEIFNQINPLDKSLDKDLTFELMNLGSFTILLDGFDEIPYDIQETITGQIVDLVRKTGKNNFVITSRPESALSTFSDFQLFHIQPLRDEEAYNIIEKLDNLGQVKLGESLISEIKEKNTQVHEFLSNPFLVSLLYKSYTYNKDIPSKKITFYEEVYSCLFKHHDLSKQGFKRPKRSNLDIYDFEIILRNIAFETSKIGLVIYTKDELIHHILKAKKNNESISFKEQNFYDDLTTTVPLFNIEGQKIKWAHKSIQDFFSAKYISNHSKKEEILELIFKSKKHSYLNIIDLLYELEPKAFSKVITKVVLENFVEFYETQFLWNKKIPKGLINERIGLTFGAQYGFLKAKDSRFSFNDARKRFLEETSAKRTETLISLYHTKPPYYFMSESSFLKEIIKILHLKGENLFMSVSYSEKTITAILDQLVFNKLHLLNDKENEVFNLKKNFALFNSSIKDGIMERNLLVKDILDYEKCKKELVRINKQIIADDTDDELDNI
ncbi:NACHT domain-containing protein [Flavobacterium sp. GSB-24]|uniref:NACHT domain-containing protein n=1 Tax=Flavobacterium sp. GSB-24 TaxID=2994319 RepID=UPI0024913B9C|nr:NACHT domain-containing protein [Flavobacterium sp. GSB-24]BDU24474.1 hypothetical protein FLGSB24_12180 [Flavobacterium sp. GSB-24]